MRGEEPRQRVMLSARGPEQYVPEGHPIFRIKHITESALSAIKPELDGIYSAIGRPSIPPEQLLKASVLMALFSVRSERQFCLELEYNMLFRFFLGLSMLDQAFDHSSFSHNRARLMQHEIAEKFFAAVVGEARARGLLSDERFSVDGTQIEAWASRKSYRRKDPPQSGPGSQGGKCPLRYRYESRTDPEARLYRKSKSRSALMSYIANALMDHRYDLIADVTVGLADGYCERTQALAMLNQRKWQAKSVAGDKAYDTEGFVAGCTEIGIEAHVAQNSKRHKHSALDRALLRTPRYRTSQRTRSGIERFFGWLKGVACFRKTPYRGRALTEHALRFRAAAYNLVRIANLCPTG